VVVEDVAVDVAEGVETPASNEVVSRSTMRNWSRVFYFSPNTRD
jgi:hypothetical protein